MDLIRMDSGVKKIIQLTSPPDTITKRKEAAHESAGSGYF